jgi:hypothetical protein
MNIGSFGEVVFEVIETKPLQKLLGPGLDEISLQVRLDTALGVIPED